jgi:hypothetical protein
VRARATSTSHAEARAAWSMPIEYSASAVAGWRSPSARRRFASARVSSASASPNLTASEPQWEIGWPKWEIGWPKWEIGTCLSRNDHGGGH